MASKVHCRIETLLDFLVGQVAAGRLNVGQTQDKRRTNAGATLAQVRHIKHKWLEHAVNTSVCIFYNEKLFKKKTTRAGFQILA